MAWCGWPQAPSPRHMSVSMYGNGNHSVSLQLLQGLYCLRPLVRAWFERTSLDGLKRCRGSKARRQKAHAVNSLGCHRSATLLQRNRITTISVQHMLASSCKTCKFRATDLPRFSINLRAGAPKKGRALPLRPMLILLAGIMGFYPASDLVFVFAKLNTLLPMSALRWCPRAGSLTGAAGQVPTPLRNVCCLVSTLCCTALPSINPPDRLPLFYLSL